MIFERKILDDLIKILSKQNKLNTLQALKYLQKKHTISRPNFYKIISKLLKRQVLVKKWKELSLNAIRMMEYLDLAESIRQNIRWNTILRRLNIGETQRFEWDSLGWIDALYWDIYLRLATWLKPDMIYHYQSHPHHSLAFLDKEIQFWENMKKTKSQNLMVYGNNDFLDQHGAKFVRIHWWAKTVTIKQNFFPEDWYILVVIGDYVVDMTFPDTVSKGFKFFFNTVNSIDEFHQDLYTSLFHQKNKFVINVSNDPRRAEKFSNHIRSLVQKNL